jgi:hypothetical protein
MLASGGNVGLLASPNPKNEPDPEPLRDGVVCDINGGGGMLEAVRANCSRALSEP